MKALLSLFILLFSTYTSAETNITFHEGGNDLYVVELRSTDNNMDQHTGLQAIAKASETKCGNKPSQLGKYRFQKSESVNASDESSFRMVQQLFCGELPNGNTNQKPTQTLNEKQKDMLKTRAVELTNTYLDALASDNFKKAYTFLSNSQKANQPFESFSTRKAQLKNKGKKIQGGVWNTTIYIDPPHSPKKGIFIAADFEREYTNLPIYCGYLVWYLADIDKEPKIIREEVGALNSEQFIKIKPMEMGKIKKAFRCKP